jgi:methyltransferase (TIGR00027 family)
MPAPSVSDPLLLTARWTAAVRAGERMRADALFDDPWAADLAGPSGMAWLADRPPSAVVPIVVRTRFFDDWLRAVAIEGPVRQVVLLGAGFDTRAWRLPWQPGTIVFEVDRSGILEEKADVLARAGAIAVAERRAVAADLALDWTPALRAAGWEASLPTAWLAEGLLFYLPIDVIESVLATVSELSESGTRLGFDIVNRAVLRSPYTKAWLDMQAAAGAPWIGALDDPAALLGTLGWSVVITQPGEAGTGHGRWTLPVPPASMPDLPHSWYVTAEQI